MRSVEREGRETGEREGWSGEAFERLEVDRGMTRGGRGKQEEGGARRSRTEERVDDEESFGGGVRIGEGAEGSEAVGGVGGIGERAKPERGDSGSETRGRSWGIEKTEGGKVDEDRRDGASKIGIRKSNGRARR